MSNIIQITDFLDPALDVYARLTENQLVNREHPEEGLFIAESPKVIHRALDAGCVPVSFLVDDRVLWNDLWTLRWQRRWHPAQG